MATAEALISDAAAEALDRDRDDWGKGVALKLDAACRALRDRLWPELACRQAPEWER